MRNLSRLRVHKIPTYFAGRDDGLSAEEGRDEKKYPEKKGGCEKKTKKSVLLTLSLLVPLFLLPSGHAQSTLPANGSFSTTVTSETVSQVDSILIIHEHFSLLLTGTLSGTTAGTATIIVNLSTGQGVFFGSQTFKGTVLTASGTAQLVFSATFVGSNFNGQSTIFGGTGGLSNLHGEVSLQGIVNVSGSYSGFIVQS